MAPEIGDRVLVAGEKETDLYVVAILARTGDGPTTIAMNGDVAVGVREGELTLAAEEGLHLVSSKDLSVTSATLRIRATEGQVVLDRLLHIGERVLTRVKRVKLVSDVIDTIAERLSQRVTRSYRFVDEMDYVRAREIDQAADKTVNIRGENTLVTAKKLVKFDGEQIHVG